MITIKIGKNNDEIIVRGKVTWMEPGCTDDAMLDAIDMAVRGLAAAKGWMVDSDTRLHTYWERIAQTTTPIDQVDLIAAAPYMYSALKEAEVTLKAQSNGNCPFSVLDAIARAEGRK